MASIARKQHVSGPTVRKYLRMDDLSEKPPVRKRRGSVVDPYPPLIERWLAEDRGSWRKQRHTATRIWEWLRDEHGAEVSLSTVTRAVARLGRESAVEPGDAFVDLVWHPDEARADFGEVDVLYGGAVQRMRRFVPDFPYSNIGLAQLMPGENAECACQALLDLFEWLGGVPERIVFGDAAGVGRGTRLFQAFQARYGFESSLCSPYAGHEKGAVEAKVGMIRRKLFVPGPGVWSPENFDSGLPDRCLELGGKPRHAKDEEEAVLFAEGRKALLPLPSKRFDVVTWKRMRADKHGVVTLDGRHRYSTDASHARRDVLVGLRALEIEILDVEGTHPAVRPRAYGQAGTSSEGTPPCGWRCRATGRTRGPTASCARCCPIRCENGSTGRTRGNGAARCGPSDAWTGKPAGPTRSGRCPRPSNRPAGPAATGVALLAARLAEGVDRVEYDDGRPGLGEYDIAFATKDEEGAE